MGCDKVRLREVDALECPACGDQVEQCEECGDNPTINEDWFCYSDGDKHYCGLCWENHLQDVKLKTKRGNGSPPTFENVGIRA